MANPPTVLNAEAVEIYESSEVDEILNHTYKNLVSSNEDFQHRGSGWVLDRLLKLDLHIFDHSELHLRVIINIKNKDRKCFLWLVIAKMYGDPNDINPNRVLHYKEYEKKFNLQGISFPLTLKDIPEFERCNNVSISVYGYQDGKDDQAGFVYLLKVSKEVTERHVDLQIIIATLKILDSL